MSNRPPSAGQRLRDNWLELLLLLVLLLALAWLATVGVGVWQRVRPEPTPTPAPTPTTAPSGPQAFDGQRALGLVSFLAALGPRLSGSEAHGVAAERIEQELRDSGWQVEVQDFALDGVARRNIVARAGTGEPVMVGTHYDTSPAADLDPDSAQRGTPSPGANDGGSGTAVLLELARSLDQNQLAGQVWLVFLDGQYSPQGARLGGGVQELASQIGQDKPLRAAVLVDLLGGAEARFSIDPGADPAISGQLWDIAGQLGYAAWFTPELGGGLELGQAALAGLGVPAAVIADPGYPFWRTLQDTPENVSPQSLERVGQVLKVFLEREK